MSLGLIFLLALIPSFIALCSSIIGVKSNPGKSKICLIQALGSGVMLAAVVTDLVPRFINIKNYGPLIAFTLGAALIIIINHLSPDTCDSGCEESESCTHEDNEKFKKQTAFLAAFVFEFIINGILIGITSLVGFSSFLLILIAICFCSCTCSLSIVARLIKSNYKTIHILIWLIILMLLLPLSAVLSHVCLKYFLGSIGYIVAFGVGILLFLSLHELFLEAFEAGKKLSLTLTFFIGFWIVLFLKLLVII
ncbi:MAG TPA: hypothetical protein QF753_15020 [Victivallales bacterium]|nr:hypothetical protein [Victivallales bacterium]